MEQFSSLLTKQDLLEEVSPISRSGNMCSQTFPHGNSLYHKIITDRVRLLLQHGLRLGGVVYNRHVITIYISWAVNLDAQHSQLNYDSSQSLYPLIHGYKFGFEDSALNSGQLIGVPVNQGNIYENHESCPGTAVTLVPCMVRVNKHAQVNLLAKWLRSIQRFGLLNIPIERCVILIGLELRNFDPRVTGIEHQHGVVLNIQVRHNVQCIY